MVCLRVTHTVDFGPPLPGAGMHQGTGRVQSKNGVWRVRGLAFMPNPKGNVSDSSVTLNWTRLNQPICFVWLKGFPSRAAIPLLPGPGGHCATAKGRERGVMAWVAETSKGGAQAGMG